jgi:hypothetical protein
MNQKQTVLYPKLSTYHICRALGFRVPPALVTVTFSNGRVANYAAEAK